MYKPTIEILEGRWLSCKCGAEIFAYLIEEEVRQVNCPKCEVLHLPGQVQEAEIGFWFCCDACGQDNYLKVDQEYKNEILICYFPDIVECGYCSQRYDVHYPSGEAISSDDSNQSGG